ncbi:MAG: glycoside hydrolase family 3 N-terminal domain-containing protein [Bacteroidales bacterium]|nr:glycoside hydrolase family 3 N-terminal domain-containing protein [Bacteroidales bacterium]MDD3906591.1 glycoside hydrolase family 3 N-terminal domain-containing protein [Bacteroidales bacterium]MDD4711820.1 glycoside hydrolase family 3 N-terminal domain-containing protein [Bacteroidales bacterium]
MKNLWVILFSLFLTLNAYAQPVMSKEEAYKKADEFIGKLTLEEKVQLTRGFNKFFFKGFEEKGMRNIYLSDATQGVNIRNNLPDTGMVKQLTKSTAFPSPILLASTFNPVLSYEYAKAIGEECRAGGIEFLLGPGLNIYRQSQCARNFEYFGEDPYLVSRMVENYVKGMQSTGTAACLKHFFGNNTEFYRKRSNSIIDERAMHEIYLPGFKAGIDAGAMSVMTSYNLINGEWAGQNAFVIKDLLRKNLGFNWLVMSDWNSVWDLEKTIKSGQNVEMPGSYDFKTTVLQLVKEGKVAEDDINVMIRPMLATCLAMNFYNRQKYDPTLLSRFSEHEKTARKVADEGIVLLKNKNNILPLDPKVNRNILVTGKFCFEIPRGYGAAEVIGYNNVCLMDALKKVFGRTVYYIEKPTDEDLKEADVVILSMGTLDRESQERPFNLPSEDEAFMKNIISKNAQTIAVINSGSGINMSAWNDQVAGLIYVWYGGQSGFEALSDILAGKVNPSGKLPITIEKTFKDSPAWGYLPEGATFYTEGSKNEQLIKVYDVKYNESVFVGYRWYDSKNITPLYPFGFGLSYTTFEISKPRLSSKTMTPDQSVICSVTVKNTGLRSGSEVVQLYVNEKRATVLRPQKELKGFQKVMLNPGESKTIAFKIESKDLAFWDETKHDWQTNSGKYNLLIGNSSRNILNITDLEVK